MQILIVEDEPRLARIIKRTLEEAGDVADIAYDSDVALERFELQPYDLIILDLLIPGETGNGVDLCKNIRRQNQDVSILMLTALDSVKSRVEGLDAGADDYLTKPFNLTELSARVRALLRRTTKSDPVVLEVDDLRLDTITRRAIRGSRPIYLTSKEYALLHYLMRTPGRVVNQGELLEHVWDYNYEGLSNVVETYIRYLRRKLSAKGEPQLIYTMRGSGYSIGSKDV